MPQLVKGGKNAFGWSKVGINGEIKIPKEVREEYNLQPTNKVIIMTGSKKSGGFSIIKEEKLRDSHLSIILENNPKLSDFTLSKGEVINYNNRIFCWIEINDRGSIILPVKTLKLYGIKPGDHILSVRGSNLGVGFIGKGPIIEEAKKHPELKIFE